MPSKRQILRTIEHDQRPRRSDYRFSDRNAVLLNAEYRWRVHRMVDAVVFYDAGQVIDRF